MADTDCRANPAYMLFRDAERGDRVSAAICDILGKKKWRIIDLTTHSVEHDRDEAHQGLVRHALDRGWTKSPEDFNFARWRRNTQC